jgi:hypothetical protein
MNTVRLPPLIGAIVGVLLFAGSAASAQTASPPTAAPKAKPKTAATAKHAAPPVSRNAKDDYWSVNYAAPTRYDTGRTVTRNAPIEQTGELGRVPMQSGQGTVGFENQSRMMPYVPGGTDPSVRKESSFVGLSINMPSESKAIALPVLPTPWSRPE